MYDTGSISVVLRILTLRLVVSASPIMLAGSSKSIPSNEKPSRLSFTLLSPLALLNDDLNVCIDGSGADC